MKTKVRIKQKITYGAKPSIIQLQLRLIMTDLVKYIKFLIENLPEKEPKQQTSDYQKQILFYCQQNSVEPPSLVNAITNCARISVSFPQESFMHMENILPSLQKTKIVSSDSDVQTFLESSFSPNSFETDINRCIFYFVRDSTLSVYLLKLLLCLQSSEIQFAFLFNEFLSYLNNKRKIEDFSENNAEFLELLYEIHNNHWSECIYLFSKKLPMETYQYFLQSIPKKIKGNSIYHFFSFFRHLYFSERSNIDFSTLNSILSPLIQSLESKSSQNDYSCKAVNFFINLMGQLFNLYPSLRESEIIFEIEKITRKMIKVRGYSGPAFRFHALLASFSNHKKIKIKIDSYPKKYYLDSNMLTRDSSPFILKAVTQLLSGSYWQSDASFNSNPNLFHSQSLNDPANLIQTLVPLITSKQSSTKSSKTNLPQIFENSQKELGQIYARILALDQDIFNRSLKDEIFSSKFINNNKIAILYFGKFILSPQYGFQSKYPNLKDSDIFSSIRKLVLEILQEPQEETLFSYDIQSFTDLLSTIIYDDNPQIQLSIYLDSLSEIYSIPKLENLYQSHPAKSHVWEQFIVPEFHPLIIENIYPLDPFQTAPDFEKHQNVTICALSLIPYIAADLKFIEAIAHLLFHSHFSISSFAAQILQALVHFQPNIFNSELSIIMKIKISSQEHVFNQLNCLKVLLQTGLRIGLSVDKENSKLIFSIILRGLCSSSYLVRQIVQSVSKLIHSLLFVLHSLLFNFVKIIKMRYPIPLKKQ